MIGAKRKDSLCNGCKNRLDTWAETLRNDHNGCNLCMREDFTEDDICDTIDAEFIGLGWVTNGRMATNFQIITKGTRNCSKFMAR